MPKKFFNTTAIPITNTGETDTQEKSITLSVIGGVNLKIYVPTCVNSVLIYRSNSVDTETLLEEYVLENTSRDQTKVSFTLNYHDSGSLTPGITPYSLSSIFSDTEKFAVPTPDYDLEEATGSLPADTYYYRVAFKVSELALAPVFTAKSVDVFVYKPDLSGVLCYTDEDLFLDVEYTEVPDPYAYIDSFYSDVFRVGTMIGNKYTQQQEIKVLDTILKKSILDAIPVDVQISSKTYLVNKPVTLVIDPPYVNLEMLENKLVGTPEYLSGTVTRRYADPGSITFYLTVRGRFLYTLATPFFKVVT